MSAGLFDRVACGVCGPLEPPAVHAICHQGAQKRNGCGHPLSEHSDGLKCRTCGRECGVYCEPDR